MEAASPARLYAAAAGLLLVALGTLGSLLAGGEGKCSDEDEKCSH